MLDHGGEDNDCQICKKIVSTWHKLLVKNLKKVWTKVYSDVCSHFWLATSADIFVAPVSKLFPASSLSI